MSAKPRKVEKITKNWQSQIPKPLYNIADSQLAQDILWADPMIGLTGSAVVVVVIDVLLQLLLFSSTKPNNVRGISNYFGEDTLDAALKQLGLSMVVCGHRVKPSIFRK